MELHECAYGVTNPKVFEISFEEKTIRWKSSKKVKRKMFKPKQLKLPMYEKVKVAKTTTVVEITGPVYMLQLSYILRYFKIFAVLQSLEVINKVLPNPEDEEEAEKDQEDFVEFSI